ncbi:MAG: ABC transporter ATP-binding protein [Anaerolineales bacterium]|nr:ABC transporter ATP-binding protein [Anaerolineales bacterium]
MSNTVISVENLSKTYRLGVIGTGTFFGDLNRWWAKKRGRQDPYEKIGETDHGNRMGETLWALDDVSFKLPEGEALGIIGRNGAGKSTLLKILSRVTAPTSGAVKVKGRIASLLEVGTGFHPELTGRENIYLNGAILGMNRAEVNRKYDEIVDFSGVEKFIDTPVKRYSSGMYVRLAFAVAAHLEPEILVVDEVLAVGDAEFQKKCLGKMSDVASEGRTVLFVSHNMQAIVALCSRAILLNRGSIVMDGNPVEVLENYINYGPEDLSDINWAYEDAPGSDAVRLKSLRVLKDNGETSGNFKLSDTVKLEMEFWVMRSGLILNPSFQIINQLGYVLFATTNFHYPEWNDRVYEPGLYKSVCTIPGHLLNEGKHTISALVIQNKSNVLIREKRITFNVHDDGLSRSGYTGGWIGAVRPLLDWDIEMSNQMP